MSELRFAVPEWAWGLWGVAAFALVLLLLERPAGRALARMISGELQERQLARKSWYWASFRAPSE